MSNIHPSSTDSVAHPVDTESMHDRVSHAIEHALHYLPSQGPIAIFVHHNTLHAFEHLPFEQAVIEGLKTYRSQPYMSEERYREEHARGRITEVDIEQALLGDLGERALDPVVLNTDRIALRRCMLHHVIRNGPDQELRWFVAETNALRTFRWDVAPTISAGMVESIKRWWFDRGTCSEPVIATSRPEDLEWLRREMNPRPLESWSQDDWSRLALRMLLRVCRRGASVVGQVTTDAHSIQRHRDILWAAFHFDCDVRVHELLIRFLSSITDQGFAQWELPNRHQGIYRAFLELYSVKSVFSEPWKRFLADAIEDDLSHRRTSMDSIVQSLKQLGVTREQIPAFVASTLLALPGWSGMVWQLETNAAWTPRPAPKGAIVDLLAVRLLLDRASITEAIARRAPLDRQRWLADHGLSMEGLSECLQFHEHRHVRQSVEQRAFILFQLAQLLGWSPVELDELESKEWQILMDEVSAFGSLERRRLFHLAYERHYRVQVLDAIACQPMPTPRTSEAISFQLVTCIDDREESLRRNLEEIDSRVETFGVAGFFSVPMYYRSASDAHYIPLCPVAVKPQHFVDEIGTLSQQELQRRQAEARRVLGYASHRIHLSSRSLAAGFVTSLLGSFASLPMVARVLAPRLTAQFRSMVSRVMRPNQATTLCIERLETPNANGAASQREPGDAGLNQGFTHTEMANMVERLLGDIGLKQFSRLVFILGHGSSSLNNPHESAYNCGACGGGRGGPNARAFALMANDYRVRRILEQRGTMIPEFCVFVGAYHNTCTDRIEYFEIDRLPPSHQVAFLEAQANLEEARRWNARERSRRFQSAPRGMSPEDALKHVEGRAEDLAQARPEYNHATHAVCVVGRRSRTRGLFMDRRAFLTSYDPSTDGLDFPILNRILQAVIPVCSGISLEYYFSTVDNVGYGCGSKLPHNITSLLGVMEGAASDLRTGLSQQMVEIHEPMRILFVIESTPEAVLAIMASNPRIDSLIRNRWVQIATLSPSSNAIHIFENGHFAQYAPTQNALPRMPDSYTCFRDRRDHLPFASIGVESSIHD